MYADNQNKFVVVLNSKREISQLMNALGHMTAGLVSRTDSLSEMKFLQYEFQASWTSPACISFYPFIVLKAKNGNQLKNLHRAVQDAEILHNVFTDTMLGTSATEQMEKTKLTPPEDLTYLGVALFGSSEQLATLTRKFSLFSL